MYIYMVLHICIHSHTHIYVYIYNTHIRTPYVCIHTLAHTYIQHIHEHRSWRGYEPALCYGYRTSRMRRSITDCGSSCWAEVFTRINIRIYIFTYMYIQIRFRLQNLTDALRGEGLGSRPKKMYGERLGDGVEYHLMKPTPRR